MAVPGGEGIVRRAGVALSLSGDSHSTQRGQAQPLLAAEPQLGSFPTAGPERAAPLPEGEGTMLGCQGRFLPQT